ncbi:unnamed protein product [Linum tenue]|uniref:Uncharacterized protein n=1 Tax=Linum tenue TaxID=586396 RepID=A0AAV0HZS6_9ROSI|nr:unnamed protein product [Linum tenue]
MFPQLHSLRTRPPAALCTKRIGGGPSRATAWRCLSRSALSSKLPSPVCRRCIRATTWARC